MLFRSNDTATTEIYTLSLLDLLQRFESSVGCNYSDPFAFQFPFEELNVNGLVIDDQDRGGSHVGVEKGVAYRGAS